MDFQSIITSIEYLSYSAIERQMGWRTMLLFENHRSLQPPKRGRILNQSTYVLSRTAMITKSRQILARKTRWHIVDNASRSSISYITLNVVSVTIIISCNLLQSRLSVLPIAIESISDYVIMMIPLPTIIVKSKAIWGSRKHALFYHEFYNWCSHIHHKHFRTQHAETND